MPSLENIKKNKLKSDIDKARLLFILIALPLFLLLGYFLPQLRIAIFPALIVFTLMIGRIKKSGLDGEIRVLSELKKLSDDYVVYNQVYIQDRFKKNMIEIDYVVLSKKLVFLIEVKNYSGKIEVDPLKKTWNRVKTSKKNNKYKSKIKNPVFQLSNQIDKFCKFYNLDRKFVRGLVCFSNKKAVLLRKEKKSEFTVEIASLINRIEGENAKAIDSPSLLNLQKILKG